MADRLDREPGEIEGSDDFQDGEGGDRGGEDGREAGGDEDRVDDDAGRGTGEGGDAGRTRLGDGLREKVRHVRSGRQPEDDAGEREGREDRQAGDEIREHRWNCERSREADKVSRSKR